jgi:branched-chain amino acid transport system ATP-binding protein
MTRPRLLILDEPSLGLAPMIVKQVFALLQHLNREEGLAILLVEQNAYAALRIAHYGIVLETGKVRLHGKAADLVKDPEVQALYLGGNDDTPAGKSHPPIFPAQKEELKNAKHQQE